MSNEQYNIGLMRTARTRSDWDYVYNMLNTFIL